MRNFWLPLGIVIAGIILIFLAFGSVENDMTRWLNECQHQPKLFTAVSFFVLISDIVLPVPNSIVMYLNGYVLGWGLGTILSMLSLMIGALVGYYLGKLFYTRFNKNNEAALNLINKYGPLIIILTRGLPILSESVCIVCGFNKMKLKNYLILNLAGYLPIALLYSIFGSYGKENDVFLLAFGLSFVVSTVFWLLGKSALIKFS